MTRKSMYRVPRPWLAVVRGADGPVVFSSTLLSRTVCLNWDDPVNVTQNHAIRAFTPRTSRRGSPSHCSACTARSCTCRLRLITPWAGSTRRVSRNQSCAPRRERAVGLRHCQQTRRRVRSRRSSAAAVFAVHPANVAAVTPISVRSSLLVCRAVPGGVPGLSLASRPAGAPAARLSLSCSRPRVFRNQLRPSFRF